MQMTILILTSIVKERRYTGSSRCGGKGWVGESGCAGWPTGGNKGTIKIVHWNLGARKWKNKLEDFELLLEEHRPDLCFVSEANLWEDHAPQERELVGHRLILPNTMRKLKHSRIVLIV